MIFLELQNEVKNRLSISAGNTFWTDDMIKQWVDKANIWACSYHPWPFTEGSKYIPSVAGQRYYDYPVDFRSDSLTRLTIADSNGIDVPYNLIRYDAFMNYLHNNPNGDDLLFTDYERKYFINPVPTVDGLTITVWGQQVPDPLVNDGDTSPFAEGAPDGEEAIIKKALQIAYSKNDIKKAAAMRDEAMFILDNLWKRISEGQARYKSKDTPFFEVPDFFK